MSLLEQINDNDDNDDDDDELIAKKMTFTNFRSFLDNVRISNFRQKKTLSNRKHVTNQQYLHTQKRQSFSATRLACFAVSILLWNIPLLYAFVDHKCITVAYTSVAVIGPVKNQATSFFSAFSILF